MLEVAKNKTSRSIPDEQLYWFVNKVLSIEKITYLPFGEYDELICFQPNLLKESEFFKFRICTYDTGASDDGVRENRTLIDVMLTKIKSDVESNIEKFKKYYGLPSDIEYLIWDTESILLDNAIYIHRKFRPVFEAYLRYMNGDKIETEIINLKDKKAEFDEVTSAIIINNKRCSLPTAKNEEYLARAMFSREVGESVDWSIIYKEMTGSDNVIGNIKNKKTLTDTIDRLNKRIKNTLGIEDKLISCENKTMRRNY